MDQINTQLQEIANANSDLIEEHHNEGSIRTYRYVPKPSIFYFHFDTVVQRSQGDIFINYSRAPEHHKNSGEGKGYTDFQSFIPAFYNWLKLVKEYSLSPTFQQYLSPQAESIYDEVHQVLLNAGDEPLNEEERREYTRFLVEIETLMLRDGVLDEKLSREISKAKALSWHAPKSLLVKQFLRIMMMVKMALPKAARWAGEKVIDFMVDKGLEELTGEESAISQFFQSCFDS